MSDSDGSDSEDIDSLASLPDSASSDSIDSHDDRVDDAEREWKESLQQLELLLTMMVVPWFGKYIGRKCAYWGMSRKVFVFASLPSEHMRKSYLFWLQKLEFSTLC